MGLLFFPAPALAASETKVFQEGLDGYAGNQSTFITFANPDDNYGTDTIFSIRKTLLDLRAPFMQFNLSSIPRHATIDSATLELTTFSNGVSSTSANVAVHKITVPWDEATITWNNSVGAAVYDPTPVTIQSMDGRLANSISSLDLTALVQQWVDGTADNYGFMLQVTELDSGVMAWHRGFHSDDSTTQTSRPKLTISYTYVPTTGVVVTPATLPLVLGGSAGQLSANVQPDDAFNKNVQWTSSDTAIATVDASGRVTTVGLGTATITATTEEGNFTNSSTVTVSSANLSGLVISEGELSPTFNSGTTNYTATVSGSMNNLTVTPSVYDPNATVTVNGASVASGMPSQAIPLNVGNNEVKVTVTAQDQVTDKTYTIMITREAEASTPTDDGDLDSSDGSGGGVSTPTTPVNPTNPPVDKPDTEKPPEQSGGAACTKLTWSDIQNHWAKSDIESASQLCIVQGPSIDKFLPDDEVTRLQFALMVERAMKLQDSGNTAVLDNFADQADIPAWATAELSAAVGAGIIEGYEDETLRPNEKINRAEMVTMLIRGWKITASYGVTSFLDDADIPDWAKGYVAKAEREGIIQGRSNNRFEPSSTATRAEAVAVLVRMLQDKP
ncbi:S-layer homology domain-containing protein [Paenibacillus sp. GYB004]|uniref:S-layer homology domain-containing protein n=1 Tax=Paenibacillus sp. GYB004 TaxID=2994393 RepID=UPI002F962090